MKQVHLSIRLALKDDGGAASLFSRAEIEGAVDQVTAAGREIERRRGEGSLAFLDLPYAYDTARPTSFKEVLINAKPQLLEGARHIRECRGQYVHLGIGGSALGAITLAKALAPPCNSGTAAGAEVHIPDNVDPDLIGRLLARLDPARVFVNVVSKSGGTVETVATFAVLREFLQRAGVTGSELKRRIFVTTNPETGALLELARTEGFTVLPLPESVHGRFSIFAPTGLFTAAVAGIDIDALLEGARAADAFTAEAPFWQNPAQLLAALHFVGNTQKRLSTLILMPYSSPLRTVGDWYSQLVAESLGKNGQGMTPVKALGATDQHSQLQLYNDGPKDKLIVFFAARQHGEIIRIPSSIASVAEYAHLAGHSLNNLLAAERQATEVSLHLHGVPSCVFLLDRIDPFCVGALLTVLEKTVCILGELYNVNAFDQPGVEESKAYARAMLGSVGPEYDQLRATVTRLCNGDTDSGEGT